MEKNTAQDDGNGECRTKPFQLNTNQHDQTSISQFIKQEEIATGKWLSLNNVTYRDPLGRERVWEAVYRTTRQTDSSDAVCVIAILKRLLKYDCLILVKQYRPPMKCYTLELPAGLIDPSESAESCACRELREETGYSGTIKHASPETSLDPGAGNATVKIVTMEIDGDLEQNKNPHPSPDETEFIEVITIPLNELLVRLNEYAKSGVMPDSRVYTYAISLEQAKKTKHILT